MKKVILPIFCIALLGAMTLAAPAGPGYHLIKSIPMGTAPGGGEYFDYVTVDSAARRVYLSHGAEVKVIDADNFSTIGTISGLMRCHGVLVLSELGKGFITDGDAGNVVVFDLKTLKITGKIKNASDTDSIIYDSASKLIFTFNGDSKNATAIDPVKVSWNIPPPMIKGQSTTTMKKRTMSLSSTRAHSRSRLAGPSRLPEHPQAWRWIFRIDGYFRPAAIRHSSS
jgi:DNA-binding beta-propeller fold protein YncE